jgi:hypothetical protein
MKKLFSTVLVLATICLSFTNCSPEEKPTEPNNAYLLTKTPWKFENAGVDLNKDGTVDVGDLEPCQTDDLVTFFKNNTATLDPKEQKCEPDEVIENVKWSWRDAEQKSIRISYTDGSADDIADVLEISETRLVLKVTEGGSPAGIPDFIIILKH